MILSEEMVRAIKAPACIVVGNSAAPNACSPDAEIKHAACVIAAMGAIDTDDRNEVTERQRDRDAMDMMESNGGPAGNP